MKKFTLFLSAFALTTIMLGSCNYPVNSEKPDSGSKLSYAFPKCPEKNSYLLQTLITAFKDSLKTKSSSHKLFRQCMPHKHNLITEHEAEFSILETFG